MKRNKLFKGIFCLSLFFLGIMEVQAGLKVEEETPKIKVACIGNSITEGMGVPDWGRDSYPSVLQRNLGTDKYDVRNFGLCGRVMTREPIATDEESYWSHPRAKEAFDFEPDIVIIKLGTNDSDSRWPEKFNYHYKNDYITMIDSLKKLPSNPVIYTCLPIPMRSASQLENLVNGVIPIIREVAEETGSVIIDLHTPFLGKGYLLPDGLHPDQNGAIYLAHLVAKAVCPECELPELPSDIFLFLSSFDRTDKSISMGSSIEGLDVTPLFDNDASTGIEIPFDPSIETSFELEMEENLKVSAYSITSNSQEDSPVAWELQGLSSTGRWTRIDEQKDVDFLSHETKVFENFYTSYDGLRNYTKYRLLIKANRGSDKLAIQEWQLFGSPAGMKASVTSNGGKITDQYNLTHHEGVQNLIDANINTKYCAVDKGETYWIQYVSTVPAKLNRYTLTSANDAPERDPVDWTLEGSVNGTNWVQLDRQSGQEFVGRYSTLEYPIETEEEYTYFRLNITKLKDGNTLQFSEWQLFGESSGTGINEYDSSGLTILTDKNWLSIFSQDDTSGNYEVLSVAGKTLFRGHITEGTGFSQAMDTGIYLVSFRSAKENLIKKVIIK